MNSIVCSYTNPDLDGVACAVALESLNGGLWKARVSGEVDAETGLVLGALGIAAPSQIVTWDGIDEIWLVDTHHLVQLPKGLPASLVVKITDHHPGGNPSSFPNAVIQNELVGAAATLVAEQYELLRTEIPAGIAILLQAAIMSNTLEFRSRSTSPRDERMYGKLQEVQRIDPELINGMRECRRGVLGLSSERLVRYDNKQFETRFGKIVIGQIEAPGAIEALGRPDVKSALRALVAEANTSSAILNLVDTANSTSAVICTDPDVADCLSKSLGAGLEKGLTILVNRVLQRKTDIVPALLGPA